MADVAAVVTRARLRSVLLWLPRKARAAWLMVFGDVRHRSGDGR